MRSQRGSVLAGVLGLSVVMAIAAGGMIVASGNAGNLTSASNQDLSLHYAAESGMLMGARWIRTHTQTTYASPLWTTGTLDLTGGYSLLDGFQVKTWIEHISGGIDTLRTRAFLEGGKDTLQLSWTVDAVGNAADPNRPILSNWKEKYVP